MWRPYISSVRLNKPIAPDSYLPHIPAGAHLIGGNDIAFRKPVTFLVGENGTGKSTLIEAIAVAYGFNPEGGTRNFRFSTARSHSELGEHLELAQRDYARDGFFLRAESFYNVASYINELDDQPAAAPPVIASYGGVSLHHQSHGESFLSLVQHRFGGHGLYILDEPEAALSPMRLLTLLAEIHRLVEQESQLIIATHSPLLMAYPDAEILELSVKGIHPVPYKETAHYQCSKLFFTDPDRMVERILE